MCTGEYRKSQIFLLLDGILINAAVILTMGVFLSGYVVFLGGSDFMVGILNNSNTWAAFVALFSFLIYENKERRKKLLISLNICARLLLCSIVFLPMVIKSNTIVLTVVSVMVILANVLWGIYNVGATVWLINILPQDKRKNGYIYFRMLLLRISFTISTIVMGFVLDWFHKSYTGFLVVFGTSLVLSIADVLILMNVDEPLNKVDKDRKFTVDMFLEPVKNQRFRLFLIFIFMFYLCLGIATSFTPLYQIRYLKLDYSFISIINVISYVALIMFTGFWGRVEVKKGLRFVFKITALFVICEILIYSFLTRNTIYLLFLSPIVSGIGYSGFNVSIMTYRFDIIPKTNKTIYEGWFGAVMGISMLIAPVVGSGLLKSLPNFSSAVYKNSNFQLLYLISFILTGIVIYLMLFNSKKFITDKKI